MLRTLLVLVALAGCTAAPELSAELGAIVPGDGGADASLAPDAGSVTTPCGAVTCSPSQFCVRRHSGVDGGAGLTPQGCVTAASASPTCADSWTNAACAPTACRDVILDAGHFLDCWGQ